MEIAYNFETKNNTAIFWHSKFNYNIKGLKCLSLTSPWEILLICNICRHTYRSVKIVNLKTVKLIFVSKKSSNKTKEDEWIRNTYVKPDLKLIFKKR
jgi:hypothetical protein